jgi:ureidoglycolate lyase
MSDSSATTLLNPEPLTKHVFHEFGDVIETDGARHFGMNGDALERYYDLAEIDIGVDSGDKARVAISIVETKQVATLPYRVEVMERHPLGSQAFIPLDEYPQLIVVAPATDELDVFGLRAFYSSGRQGINYRRGVWHMPMIALAAGQRWLIIDRMGRGSNCDEVAVTDDVIKVSRY